jgi:hypothetical protein
VTESIVLDSVVLLFGESARVEARSDFGLRYYDAIVRFARVACE